jgi:hypothetical protein
MNGIPLVLVMVSIPLKQKSIDGLKMNAQLPSLMAELHLHHLHHLAVTELFENGL